MTDGEDPKPAGKKTLKQRLSALFAEYGKVAIATYFTISILAIIGFSIAFAIGVAPSSATGVLGVIAAGWVAAKATLPIRVLITLALTPAVSYVVTRRRRAVEGSDPESADGSRGPNDL